MRKINKKRKKEQVSFFFPALVLSVIFILSLSFFIQHYFASTSQANTKSLLSHIIHKTKAVCGLPGHGKAFCHAHITVNDSGLPLTTTTPPINSYGPVQFHMAYNLPCSVGGSTQSICVTPQTYATTIAVVDAYNTPSIENDLGIYDNTYGIPACTKANGCLQIVDQNGGTAYPTTVDQGWALETSMDVEVAHAICQTCKILLVEANSNSISDLLTGINTASQLGSTAISNSYGSSEWSGENYYDNFLNHPGIAITASAGDSGYGVGYPAASPNVVAVGGTSLQIYTDNTYASESVWSSTGSGCSSYEKATTAQMNYPNWNSTGCGNMRGINDIAADADPNTGAAVYDSTPYNGATGWYQVGGTSLSSPIIAGIFALGDNIGNNVVASSILYSNINSSNSHDILSGSNGSCGTIMCQATIGYDGPTGLGTPNGITGFMTAIPTPTPTLSPTSTPTPTPTNDTTAPSITLISPINGSTVLHKSIVSLTANASDNVGVTKVEFYVNNKLFCTKTTTPYACSWKVPGRPHVIYVITAKAYDAANNSASSSVQVTSN